MSAAAPLPERNLDILRAVAVLCVFLNHVGNVLIPGAIRVRPDELGMWGMLGRAGVLIFFVHTAFVLMGSLDRMRAEGRHGRHLTTRFYLRRALRIYPLAVVVILLVVVLRLPLRPELWMAFRPPSPGVLLSNLALVQNLTGAAPVIVVLWSLPIEVQMYVLLPALAWALRHTRLRHLAWFWVVAVGALVITRLLQRESRHTFDLFLYAPCFVAGAISYFLCRRLRAELPSWVWLPGLVGLLAVFAVLPVFRSHGLGEPRTLATLALTAVIAIGLVLVREPKASALTAAAHAIAKYSYAIYLLHVPLMAALLRIWPAPASPLWWVILLAALALSSWAAYTWIERPGIRLGQRLTQVKTPGDVAWAA